jgi:hypothetical protein
MSRAAYIRGSLEQRFWPKVDKSGPNGCWVWTAFEYGKGYGGINIGGGRIDYAHRVAYRLVVGPIPDDLQLDHLCRNRRCVNPEHLEPVTTRVNLLRGEGPTGQRARQTHCKYGHPFDEQNTRRHSRYGTRVCKRCDADHQARLRATRKVAGNG